MGSSKIQEYNLDPNMGLAKESTSQEILSMVGQGVTAQCFKSIQRIVYTLNKKATTGSVNIQPVTAANCIVLFERLYCSYDGTPRVLYTLNDSSITLQFAENNSQETIVGFWIIELYM